MEALLTQGHNPDRAVPAFGNRMLELSAKLAVDGHRCPVIAQNPGLVRPFVDHRFDGEDHTGLEARVLASDAVVRR